jgi:hypothetical protein
MHNLRAAQPLIDRLVLEELCALGVGMPVAAVEVMQPGEQCERNHPSQERVDQGEINLSRT